MVVPMQVKAPADVVGLKQHQADPERQRGRAGIPPSRAQLAILMIECVISAHLFPSRIILENLPS